jgi:hypothetical protein
LLSKAALSGLGYSSAFYSSRDWHALTGPAS